MSQTQCAKHYARLLIEIDITSNPNKNYRREGHYPCFIAEKTEV